MTSPRKKGWQDRAVMVVMLALLLPFWLCFGAGIDGKRLDPMMLAAAALCMALIAVTMKVSYEGRPFPFKSLPRMIVDSTVIGVVVVLVYLVGAYALGFVLIDVFLPLARVDFLLVGVIVLIGLFAFLVFLGEQWRTVKDKRESARWLEEWRKTHRGRLAPGDPGWDIQCGYKTPR